MTVCTNAVPMFGLTLGGAAGAQRGLGLVAVALLAPDVAPAAAVGMLPNLVTSKHGSASRVVVLVAAQRFAGDPVD